MIGLALYHALDLTEQPEVLDNLLTAVRTAVSEDSLGYVQGQLASSDRFSRQQKIKPAVLEQLRTDLRGHVFRSLIFDELPKSKQEASSGYTSLQVDLKPARSPKVSSDELALCPYRIGMLAPRTVVQHSERLQQGIIDLAVALNAPYGFVYLGGGYRDVLMEVVSTPMFPWGYEMSAADLQRQARLSRCQTERVRIGSVTCGAYWGNVLGKQIVERLGGLKRAKQEAPVARAIELPGSSLYLQLTEDLPDPSSFEYQRSLAALDEYLSPVSVKHQTA